MNAVRTPHFALNWDLPMPSCAANSTPFRGWDTIPKNRIHHCHCKNAVKSADGKIDWAPVGKGIIDWTAQFRALKKSGFRDAVSLETHWHGAALRKSQPHKLTA